jgi:hypothetical protein
MSNKSNNRRQMPSLYSWRMEKLIVTIMYCSILPMMSDQRTLSALSHLSRGYDMVQVYNKMSDYNDKELWSANKPSWDTVYQTPKKIQHAYNRECGWR